MGFILHGFYFAKGESRALKATQYEGALELKTPQSRTRGKKSRAKHHAVIALMMGFQLISSFPSVGFAARIKDFAIVEYNATARGQPPDLDRPFDEKSLRELIAEDEQREQDERQYVAAKISTWSKNFGIPSSDIHQLDTSGTAPYVIEATPLIITKMRAEATWDPRISVMTSREFFDFEAARLDLVFNTRDTSLIGEFVSTNFKNEMLFSVWNAAHATSKPLSEMNDIYQNIVKNVAIVSLRKLNQLEFFLKQKVNRWLPTLIRTNRLAKHIISGSINFESQQGAEAFPTRSDFFESLEFFDYLGLKLLLNDPVSSRRISERWLAYHSRTLEIPQIRPQENNVYPVVLALLGARIPTIRNEFALDLASMLVEHVDNPQVVVTGIENDRLVRLAFTVAQTREALEHEEQQRERRPAITFRARAMRRQLIARDLLRNTVPETQVYFGDKPHEPAKLLMDIVDALFENASATSESQAMRFGRQYSHEFFRHSLIKITEFILQNTRNERFRTNFKDRFLRWDSKRCQQLFVSKK